MKQDHKLLVWGVAALAVAVHGSMAHAQRPAGGRGGRSGGGFFGMGAGGQAVRLLARQDVRKELELLDNQVEQLQGVRENVDMRSVFEGLRELPRDQRREKMQEAMQRVREKIEDKVGEILLPHQLKRLKQLEVQYAMRGAAGILRGSVAEQLGISETQSEELREKHRELRREMEKQLQADLIKQLTPAQQKKLKGLMGEPFTFEDEANRPVRRPDGNARRSQIQRSRRSNNRPGRRARPR